MISLCRNWEFTPVWSEDFLAGLGTFETVELPHTAKEIPLHYASSDSYQMVCGYRKKLTVTEEMAGKRLFLQFDGAGHIATVYVNGTEAAHHRCGYTAFRFEITDLVHPGENTIAVKLDTTENSEVPPFGFVIDYLTFGGLYREVWLDVKEESLISDLYITTPTTDSIHLEIRGENLEGCAFELEVLDAAGYILLNKRICDLTVDVPVEGARPWTVSDPYRHTLVVQLERDGQILDRQEVKFGFRRVDIKADGFYLNGEKLFLRGLNRHQSYPYVGYAAPERLQREDARILKEELGCVIVRTSHYPQSHHFIDECDKLGLLVFTEIPGWQHIGDEAWQEQAIQNTREMVLQYRNHPSIVFWGTRINESQDNDELYRRTNEAAKLLDRSRPTTGVRFIEKSHLIEDVYSYNDFSHMGTNGGVKPKKNVTPDLKKPLLITEHNGHMFPTKSFDPWSKRQEHALRHARVQHDAEADGGHIGCIGWCMFDYNTHKDFGSGDRICYHGVLDAFRNPKLAAAVYAGYDLTRPTLAVGSPMDIGDYAGGQIGDVYVFSNADEVRLYKNDQFVGQLANPQFGIFRVEDTVGCLLETQEGFDKKKAELLRKCLVTIGRKGLAGLTPGDYAQMAAAMLRYQVTFEDAFKLYGKYIGNWGGEATVWRFDAISGDQVVASRTCCPSDKLHLEAAASHTALHEGATYDMAAVRITVRDEFGNIAPYAQLPVKLALEGPAQLVGPDVVTAEGGMCGTYIRTVGEKGSVKLTISSWGLEDVTIVFTVA